MIAKLTGLIERLTGDSLIINVNGVGYLVFCSTKTLNFLDSRDDVVSLYIETHVRQDHIQLFGFAEEFEQQWFSILTTVQGVGNKAALAILSVIDPNTLSNAIISGDKALITQAPGVGPKLANRLISELKEKLPIMLKTEDGNLDDKATNRLGDGFGQDERISDAVSALENLSYARNEAYAAAVKVVERLGKEVGIEVVIKNCLLELSSTERKR